MDTNNLLATNQCRQPVVLSGFYQNSGVAWSRQRCEKLIVIEADTRVNNHGYSLKKGTRIL